MLQRIYDARVFVNSIKDLLRNPLHIQHTHVAEYFPWRRFLIMPKLDGLRCLLLVVPGMQLLVFETRVQVVSIYQQADSNFVLECELVADTLYAHDLHMLDGLYVRTKLYSHRLQLLHNLLRRHPRVRTSQSSLALVPVPCARIHTRASPRDVRDAFNHAHQHMLLLRGDGLILKSDDVYHQQVVLKWKPKERISVDFYCERVDTDKYALFTYAPKHIRRATAYDASYRASVHTDDEHQLVLFHPTRFVKHAHVARSEQALHQKVGEFVFDFRTNAWQLLQIRTDKDPLRLQFGNYIRVAESLFANDVSFDDLVCPNRALPRTLPYTPNSRRHIDELFASAIALHAKGARTALVVGHCTAQTLVALA